MPINSDDVHNISLTKRVSSIFSNFLTGRTKPNHLYLNDEFRSPIKEKHDCELEFILDVFTKKHFDPAKYLSSEYERVDGIEHTQKILDKMDKCKAKTSVSLKEMVQDNYVDFISCFNQIHDIEQFFSKNNCNIYFEKLVYKSATILRYQDALCFDLNVSKWEESLNNQNIADKDIFYDENNIVVIPGNDMVDSPSALIDDIMAMCDEKKWDEAISILNMITQDMYRGEYDYLKAKTRKQIKKQIKRFRKIIYNELAKILIINACNKLYRRRLTTHILKIQKCRYFNRGIKLYLQCKLKELQQSISIISNKSDSKTYVSGLTILIFDTIRELISEFNEILIESGNRRHKDALSYLTVFILNDILFAYTQQYKIHVFEATKCDISLKLIGECLRISFGHLNKLKWSGLYLEMCLNNYLFKMVCNSLNIYFDDEINEAHHCLLTDNLKVKEISLLPLQNTNNKNGSRSLSFRKYQTVAMHIDIDNGENNQNKNNSDKTTIFITSSTQIIYENIRKCLSDSRSLLSFSYYPIMTKQLLSVFIENIIKYLQTYCSNITHILREYDNERNMMNITEIQCIAIISNVYFIANDLLQRINNRLLKQSRFLFQNKKGIQRIDSFKNKLTILYQEQIKYFVKTTSSKLIKNVLQFDNNNVILPIYYNDNRERYNDIDIMQPSQSWIEMIEKLVLINELCHKYLNENVSDGIIISLINTVIKQLNNNEKYWMNTQDHTDERNMSYYGLQQFIFDIKFFQFVANTYLDDEAKLITHNIIINNAIKLYCDIDTNNAQRITSGVVIKCNEHYKSNIEQFLSSYPHLNCLNTSTC